MITISNKEVTLLGLIFEKPKHAYEIENDIKLRSMREWTEISMSSVYKLLNKLEKQELLKSKMNMSKNNISQKIYSITQKGKDAFNNKLEEITSKCEALKDPFDIFLSNIKLMDKKTVNTCLKSYSEAIDKAIKCYKELETYLIENNCPIGNLQLATRRLYLFKAEKEWLNKFSEEFKK
jgi:DNA-binding PadR family transcriptional regulator